MPRDLQLCLPENLDAVTTQVYFFYLWSVTALNHNMLWFRVGQAAVLV